MNKHNRKWFLLIPLVIIIIVIVALIILKKGKIEEDNKPNFSTDLVGTNWYLDRMEVVTNEGTTPDRTIPSIELQFYDEFVSVCTFYNEGNQCSINEFTRDGDTYSIKREALTSVYGTVKFDENGNIYLEQEDTEDYKTVYYFIKMS